MDMNSTITPRQFSDRALEDLKLVERAAAGCQDAFTKIYQRYYQTIFHKMRKMVHSSVEAEDLATEALGKAFAKIGTYVPHYAFSTWLFRIAINNCIDHERRKRLKVVNSGDTYNSEDSFDPLTMVPAYSSNPEEKAIRAQRIAFVSQLISELSPKYAQIINLRYFEELSYEEIADSLQIPLGTVKANLFRAKELMYQKLQSPLAKAYFERTARHEEVPTEAAKQKKTAKATKQVAETPYFNESVAA
jgi:RNA polymerase sigma factor (sigma-70 family)